MAWCKVDPSSKLIWGFYVFFNVPALNWKVNQNLMISNGVLVLRAVIYVTVMFSKSDKRSSWISLICADLDDCQTGSFRCHARAVCVNVSGSYSCRCRPGYVGNGKTVCEGKVCSAFPCNETKKKQTNKHQTNEKDKNKKGSVKVSSVTKACNTYKPQPPS